jgi:hypothetical protein
MKELELKNKGKKDCIFIYSLILVIGGMVIALYIGKLNFYNKSKEVYICRLY